MSTRVHVRVVARLQLLVALGTAPFLLGGGGLNAAPAACSEPVGFLKAPLPAASDLGPALHSLGIPFQRPSVFQGSVSGVGTGSIRCSAPGWAAGQFIATPHFLKLRSGTGAGRAFLITANTGDTLTVQVPQDVTLTSLVRENDVMEVFPAHTLESLLGTGTGTLLQTGTSAAEADLVRLHDGTAWSSFFHNGTTWRKVGSQDAQTQVALRPDQGLLVVRRGKQALNLPLGGAVGVRAELSSLPASGETLLAHRWPVASTLQALNLHKLSGWKSAPAAAQADKVLLWNGTYWDAFYYSGTRWEKAGSFASQDNATVPKTGALLVRRAGASAASWWSAPVPFVFP